jgi:hypothetical protein
LKSFFILSLLILKGNTGTGVSSTTWFVPEGFIDGEYELAVRVQCQSTVAIPVIGFIDGLCMPFFKSFLGLDSFVSPPISGLIDRIPPSEFGHGLLPANDKYLPGNEISATFDEDINCRKPYPFTALIMLGTNPVQFLQESDLSLFCDGRKVFIELAPTSLVRVRCFVRIFFFHFLLSV